MPNWLIVLITILVVFAIIAFAYMILAFRKVIIVSKKLDYLVEDLTYKSEKMNDVVSTVTKISNYLDSAEYLVKNNADTLNTILASKNKKNKKIDKDPNEKIE